MNALKKQSTAWILAAVMIVIAIVIGQAKKPVSPVEPPVGAPSVSQPGDAAQVDSFYVYDEANILSDRTEEKLTQRNLELYQDMDVLIAVVTCNDGGDIYDVALAWGDQIGLGGYDFILTIDMTSQQYILVQGPDLVSRFSDSKCDDYAYDYMQDHLEDGDFDSAVLDLTEALEDWYRDNY